MTTPDPDPPDEERQAALFLLRRLTVEIDTFARGFAEAHELHPTDVRALVAMLDAGRAGESMSPGRLAQELDLSSASTTALVDRLARAGHAVRRPHPTDRRRAIVEPTDGARAEGGRWFGGLNRDMLAVLDGFDDAEVDAFVRIAAALVEVVRRHNADPTA
jgi:DNA-binding MarR family transcriptional regulator